MWEAIKIALQLAAEIIGVIKERGIKDAGQVKLCDLPGWQAWSQKPMSSNMAKLLREFRKIGGKG
ncbi:MAG: hypothetical protein AB1442_16865 [Nitrospirota bacterium]